MKSVIGYVLAVAGLAFLILSFGDLATGIPVLASLSNKGMSLLGVAFVVAGVLAIRMFGGESSSRDSGASEVPIFEGEGKKRRIVGYRRH